MVCERYHVFVGLFVRVQGTKPLHPFAWAVQGTYGPSISCRELDMYSGQLTCSPPRGRESKRGRKTARARRQRPRISLPPVSWFVCIYPAERPSQHVWTSVSRDFLPAIDDRVVRYWPDPFLVSSDDVDPSHYAKWYTHWLTNYEILDLARSRLIGAFIIDVKRCSHFF